MNVLVLGAGQLARMMALAGAPLDLNVTAFDVTSGNMIHPVTQTILGKRLESGIEHADVITAEFEHISPDVLALCEASGKFFPGENAILIGGDRRKEKKLLDNAGVKNARYHIINTSEDLDTAIKKLGFPMILKCALNGYDGKGQWRLKHQEDVTSTWHEINTFFQRSPRREHQCIIAEEFISFDREVSLIGARNAKGKLEIYPLTENIHHEGILSLSICATENEALQNQAEMMFKAIAEDLNYVGILAIEFFEVNGVLMVNEIAPRVHNSGHWTQQGAEVCQFENHLRAICDLPLGSAKQIRPSAMINMVGNVKISEDIMRLAHVHWYNKSPRPNRKIGHINVCEKTKEQLIETLEAIIPLLDKEQFPVLHEIKIREHLTSGKKNERP